MLKYIEEIGELLFLTRIFCIFVIFKIFESIIDTTSPFT